MQPSDYSDEFWMHSDLFQREQQPPHSEWSRCCRRSSGTGLPGPPESQSTPKTGSHRDSCMRGKGRMERDLQSARGGGGSHTAVWAVMWVQPTMLAPASGFSPWALFLKEMRADMSVEEHTASAESDRTQRSGSNSMEEHFEYINRPAQTRQRCSKW